ncbi:protein Sla2p [Trichomonascus vanleenenianus]|uniref:Sla2p n=1 Tax=Trichomonascus vanleenenianus TaxID=2268995 RepID=UPI003EC9E3B0
MSGLGSGALTRGEQDLSVNIKKAVSPDETAPKRKHVRACILQTWDSRSGRAFWNGMKLQPIHGDEVQVFKALITVHKVLQEGHMAVLKEAQGHINWLESLGRDGLNAHGYGKLIQEYVRLLLKKLDFHRTYPAFNGTFEYEEYVSLRTIDDPNEGYEAIVALMNLQDAIDDFQRLVFATIHHGRTNECKISSLTPMVAESYGIYRFLTSMLRALHQSTNDDDALEPLRTRYYSQYRRLRDFYYDCSSLKYLTSLVSIPNLPKEPPNLYGEPGSDAPPALPKRPSEREEHSPAENARSSGTPEPLNDWWGNAQQEYDSQQSQLEAMREAELRQQQEQALQMQREFEEQQRLQMEQQRQAQEALARDQLQRQAEGRVAQLERDLLALKGQYEQGQLMLEQYDAKVKVLENELAQVGRNNELQLSSKNDLISSLQEQVKMWKNKYEALAKLYSQLRQEHLDLLQKFKQVQSKAASAQEAIDKREKLERDLKAKNIELADLIRERDRARFDLDRANGGHKEKMEKLEREVRLLQEKLDDAEKSKGSDLSLLLSRHNREIGELEQAVKAKQKIIDSLSSRASNDHLEQLLRDKEEEMDIIQSSFNELEKEFRNLKIDKDESETAMNEQIDTVLLDQLEKFNSIVDAILASGYEQIQNSLFEFESGVKPTGWNFSPNYLLSVIEKAMASVAEFSSRFKSFITVKHDDSHSDLIRAVFQFSSGISEVLLVSKGVTKLAKDEAMSEEISEAARESAYAAGVFLSSLYSESIAELNDDEKVALTEQCEDASKEKLKQLNDIVGKLAPKMSLESASDLGELVDTEFLKVAQAIENANSKLHSLLANKDASLRKFDIEVHDSILEAALAITNAISGLIKAATSLQEEIVSQGRGSQSRTAYLKKHNRWTEGLISAAKAVATSTNILIETADGVLSGKNDPEELIVASNEVASATAQLVAASRVKAEFMSTRLHDLEKSSRKVTSACRLLVNKVQEIISERAKATEGVDYSKLSPHEFKTAAMEQQVEVLRLESQLEAARNKLFEIRRFDYQDEEEE